MKKFVSMLLVSTMIITSLTACGNTNESSSNQSSSSNTSNTSSDGESSTGDSSSDNESSTPDDDSSSSEGDASNPEGDSSNPEESDDDLPDDIIIDNSGLEYPDNKAGNMAKTILEQDEWPQMDIILPEYVSALLSPDFNTESYDEFCFASNIISAQLNKVIIIKPKAGSEDDAQKAIDGYYEAVKTDPNLAFYPMQQVSAEGAVKGKTDDGYYYVIVHANGADIETAMLAAL